MKSVLLVTAFVGSAAVGAWADSLSPQERAEGDQVLAAIDRQVFTGTPLMMPTDKSGEAALYRYVGEAEARHPGRELRAIVWLAASLADDPRAAGREQVRAKIKALDEASRARIERFVQADEDAVLKTDAYGPRDELLREVVDFWASLQDDSQALRVIGMIQGAGAKSEARSSLAVAETTKLEMQQAIGPLAEIRRRLEAARELASPARGDDRTFALYHVACGYLDIAARQIREGDLPGARQSIATARAISATLDTEWGPETLGEIATTEIGLARVQVARGDAAGARVTLADAAKVAEGLDKPNEKLDLALDLAHAQVAAGDLAAARQCLAGARPYAAIYNDADDVRLTIIRAELGADDPAGAQVTADQLSDPGLRTETTARLATAAGRAALESAVSRWDHYASDRVAMDGMRADAPQWLFCLQGLDRPWFTAYPDFSNFMEMAKIIEKTPVQNGQQWAYRPDDQLYARGIVCRQFVAAQSTVDGLLKLQFGP